MAFRDRSRSAADRSMTNADAHPHDASETTYGDQCGAAAAPDGDDTTRHSAHPNDPDHGEATRLPAFRNAHGFAGPDPGELSPSDVLHQASHDLKEPLRVIGGFAKILDDREGQNLSPEGREFLGEIVRATKHMQGLVGSILEMGRAERSDVVAKRFQLHDVITEAWANVHGSAEEKGATITYDQVPDMVGDPSQFVRVFQNLFSNAIKFHRPGLAPEISVAARTNGGMTRVTISDNGEGIPPDQLASIFMPFKRLHGEEIPGTGVGLAIVRQIIERNGGRIWVESTPGVFSRFHIEMPAVATEMDVPNVPSMNGHDPARRHEGPWRVVLTDDVPALRRLLKIYLERNNQYQVVGEAGDGIEALDVVHRTQPDLLLLDLSMPRMDGLEVVANLRRNGQTLKIVVLSAFTEGKMGRTATRLGADGYLEKGIEPDELIDRLGALLAGVPAS